MYVCISILDLPVLSKPIKGQPKSCIVRTNLSCGFVDDARATAENLWIISLHHVGEWLLAMLPFDFSTCCRSHLGSYLVKCILREH